MNANPQVGCRRVFDAEPPDGEGSGSFLMRALVVARDLDVMASWRLALARKRIDTVEAVSTLEAIWLGTPVGFDLIVVTACPGEFSAAEFIALVNRGLFGVTPPPVIVELRDFGSILESGDGAFSGCVIVESRERGDHAAAIDRAFSKIEERGSETGERDA
jgi:hypothetical protein